MSYSLNTIQCIFLSPIIVHIWKLYFNTKKGLTDKRMGKKGKNLCSSVFDIIRFIQGFIKWCKNVFTSLICWTRSDVDDLETLTNCATIIFADSVLPTKKCDETFNLYFYGSEASCLMFFFSFCFRPESLPCNPSPTHFFFTLLGHRCFIT